MGGAGRLGTARTELCDRKCPQGMPEEFTEDQCAGGKVEDDGEVGRTSTSTKS